MATDDRVRAVADEEPGAAEERRGDDVPNLEIVVKDEESEFLAEDVEDEEPGEGEGGQDEPEPRPKRGRVSFRGYVNTPTVLQMEAVECGAASLAIILAFYGKYVPLEELRIACGVSRDGSNAAAVMDAAEAYGLVAEAFSMELDRFYHDEFPCIVFWDFNHFLVVEGFNRRHVFLNDPAYGRRTVSHEEFDKGFSGIAMYFKPRRTSAKREPEKDDDSGAEAVDLPVFERGGRKPSTIAALARRLPGVRVAVSFCILAGLGLVIPGLAIPTFSKTFVDDILIAASSHWLGPLLFGMAVAAGLRAALTALQKHHLMRAHTKMAITSTGRFLWHILRLPIDFYMQRYAGEVSSRVASNSRIAAILTGDLAVSAIGLVTAVFFAAILIRYDPILAAIGIGLSLLNIVILRMVSRKRGDESQRMLQESGKLMAATMGGIQNIETIKASARESDLFARWAGYHAKATIAEQRLAGSTAYLDVAPMILTLISTALVLGIGGLRVIDGAMTIGMLVAFQALLLSFAAPIDDMVRMGEVIQRVAGDMKRLDDVTNYEIDESFARDKRLAEEAAPDRRLSGYLELRNVTFGYNRKAPPLLKDFSLRLAPGDRVALVGASGSGKSTVAKLINGLYRPWSGEILFDGSPRESLPRTLLANSCAMVDQDIFFFEGTIRENIALWDTTLPDDAIQRAAKDACIHGEISARKGAYASKVEEGGRNFSGGQRQRLEIARALAIDPTLIVLDEATSALDAATEKMVDDNIRRRGCTCVIVAHRLSTIRDCAEIIVLDRGRVVQRGTHEELIKIEGPYRTLILTE